MKIAIASSGLGRVSRGIETWAWDTACGLAERGADVELFCAKRAGGQPDGLRVRELPCLRRDSRAARVLSRIVPGFAWRWDLKSSYGWEQLTFWFRLWPLLCRGRFDILHVQDPMLADWCRRFRRAGLLRTIEILAHGTEESDRFLGRLEYVQHLAPWHLEQVQNAECGMRNGGQQAGTGSVGVAVADRKKSRYPMWTAMPNFVDTGVFSPAASAEQRRSIRERLGVPDGAFVVGCVAAVKCDHKRIDHLVREVARLGRAGELGRTAGRPLFLLVAGARTTQTLGIEEMVRSAMAGVCSLLTDLPRGDMPDLYRAMDVFVLTSLFEMMPIAVIEAMASGLPAIVNRHPVLEWIVGEGGECIDMARDGELAAHLARIDRSWIDERGAAARKRAEQMFSVDVVIGQYLDYYGRVLLQEEGRQN